MFRVTQGDNVVEIMFKHKMMEDYEIEGMTGTCVDEKRKCSLATVIVNGLETGRGIAICHPGDNFCRAIGRKRALKDALSSVPKKLRTAIWRSYLAKCSY